MNTTDKTIPLTVIGFLGSSLVIGVSGVLILAYDHIACPEGLLTIVGGLVGVMGTLLTSAHRDQPGSTPVEVTNQPDSPIPTEPVKPATQEN